MTPFSTENEREEMDQFMKLHFKPFHQILEEAKIKKIHIYPKENPPSIRLAYSTGEGVNPIILGFDYGAGESREEIKYYYLLCYWMAIHGGEQKVFGNKELEYKQSLPYIIYDGVEEWAIFADKEVNLIKEYVQTDSIGFKTIQEKRLPLILKVIGFLTGITRDLKKLDKRIQEELITLTKKWNEQK